MSVMQQAPTLTISSTDGTTWLRSNSIQVAHSGTAGVAGLVAWTDQIRGKSASTGSSISTRISTSAVGFQFEVRSK